MHLLRIFQYTKKFCVPSVSWKTIRKSETLQTLNIKKQWGKKFKFNWLGDNITESALTPYDHISCHNHTSWFCF